MHWEYLNAKIRPTELIDIEYVARHMRDEDVEEVKAAKGFTPLQAVAYSYKQSTDCNTLTYHGVPAAIFGITPDTMIGDRASIWSLTTPEVEKMPRSFLLATWFVINEYLNTYSELYNFVDDRYKKTLGWLAHCGAKIEDPKPFGISGMPFCYFRFNKEQPCVPRP
jgi:hypothetical protein